MENLADAKRKSILAVAESLGVTFKRVSSSIYEHPDHDSFRIFADTNTFKWFSRDIQGDVITLVQVLTGRNFKDSVVYLRAGTFPEQVIVEKIPQSFSYYLAPYEERDIRISQHYLREVRGLTDETIQAFGQQGLLAQARLKNEKRDESVLVFKWRNHRGKLVGASLQGLEQSLMGKRSFKQTMKNSLGHVGFSFDIGKPNRLVFTESVIDAMSYYQLHQEQLENVRLVAMEGLKDKVIAYQILRLVAESMGKLEFLDELAPSKLISTLSALRDTTTYFQTHLGLVTLAVDNDQGGRNFCAKFEERGFPIIRDLPPIAFGQTKADWNDVVKKQESNLQTVLASAHQRIVKEGQVRPTIQKYPEL